MNPPASWAVVAGYAVPLCVLPSAVWRLSAALNEDEGADLSWYLILLSVLSMVLALLTLGLVHRWVDHRLVTIIATTGGILLVAICLYYLLNRQFGFVEQGWSPGILTADKLHPPPDWSVLRWYAPLLAWGPLLLAVTADYHRRRVSRPASRAGTSGPGAR